MLDYSSGSAMVATISAATKASEIILSEYSSDCRKVLREWLDRDPAAFDWTPHFTYVVQELEGGGESEVKERQEIVRTLVNAVVHCDITKVPPIESDYDQQYDVVICGLVFESVSYTHEEYTANISRVGKLVKPGGSMLIYGIENKLGFYTVGDQRLHNLQVTHDFAMSALKAAGFCDISLDTYSPPDDPHRCYRFLKGTRKQEQ